MTAARIEFLIRSITTAALSILLVGAVVWESLVQGHENPTLVGWAGLVIGAYFGGHLVQNGKLAGVADQRAVDDGSRSSSGSTRTEHAVTTRGRDDA